MCETKNEFFLFTVPPKNAKFFAGFAQNSPADVNSCSLEASSFGH
jgi:hypothetical protein